MVVRKITPSSAELARYGLQHRLIPSEALALVGLAVLYNAVLAALDAAGIHQTYSSVAATELLILTLTGTYIVAAKVPVFDRLCVTLAFMGLGMALYVSFASRATAIDAARTCAIIGMFMILGAATTERQILVLFRIFSIVVLLFLIIEVVDTPLYVRIFQPAAYYSDTRGIEEFSLDDSGLFRNSLGFPREVFVWTVVTPDSLGVHRAGVTCKLRGRTLFVPAGLLRAPRQKGQNPPRRHSTAHPSHKRQPDIFHFCDRQLGGRLSLSQDFINVRPC